MIDIENYCVVGDGKMEKVGGNNAGVGGQWEQKGSSCNGNREGKQVLCRPG